MVNSSAHAWSIRGTALVLAALMVATLFAPPRMAEAAVQTLTGNYVYTWADISAADDGMPSFERTYNSRDYRVGVLGPGLDLVVGIWQR